MKTLNDVHALAEQNCDGVYFYPLAGREGAIVCARGCCAIAINKNLIACERQEKEVLRHEAYHAILETWHGVDASKETIARNEYRTRKAEVYYSISFDEFQQALREGCTEVWQLADRFDESEEFIRDAIKVYQREGLYVEPFC